MTAHEFNRIKGLFDAACLLETASRQDFLERECGGDPELRETLERLLRNFEEASLHPPSRHFEPVLEPGEEISGRFLVVRFIARGGMGEVYEVLDRSLAARLALKTLPLDAATRPGDVERFKRGIRTARELPSSGICRMYDLVEHRKSGPDGREVVIPCVTMQLLEGETLASILSHARPLPLEEALRIASGIASALQVMHDHGVVHRDLKPSNVMMVPVEGSPPKPVIIDFGLARRWERREGSTTSTGPQPGAPYFLAPEVIAGQPATAAADVYAFGLVLDAMVTTVDAYPFDSDAELYWRKLNREPVKPSKRADALPQIWNTCIWACLERSPEKRPRSVASVAAALEGHNATLLDLPRLSTGVLSRRAGIGLGLGAAASAGAASILKTSRPADLETSLIVFPFRNRSGRSALDQLALGSHEELVRQLRYLPKLDVFPFPANSTPAKEHLSKARFALGGSIEVQGTSPVFRFRLDDNLNGDVVEEWSAAAPLSNPLAVQSELNQRALSLLSDRTSGGFVLARVIPRSWRTSAKLPAPVSRSAAALAAYQEGRTRALVRTPDGALAAIGCYERAIALDPDFALAYAALADIQQVLITHNTEPTGSLLERARVFADRAVALGPQVAECHVARAAARQGLWQWQESEQSYLEAQRVNTRHPLAHSWYAGLLLQHGRNANALAEAQTGLSLDPFDRASQSAYGFYLWLADRPADAYDHLSRMLAGGDEFYPRVNLGQTAAWLSRQTTEQKATEFYVAALQQARALEAVERQLAGGTDPGYLKWSDLVFAQAHAARGDRNAARFYAARLDKGHAAGKVSGAAAAMAYAITDERARALELLGDSLPHKERELLYIRIHPLFRSLHGEPRFWRIVREMGLGQAV
jgi:serine/threonine protein kinase